MSMSVRYSNDTVLEQQSLARFVVQLPVASGLLHRKQEIVREWLWQQDVRIRTDLLCT